MTLFQTLLLSTIEGLTEFLPISSTGHLILAEKFLDIQATDFVKSFDIIIQFGAILAVVWLYWKKILTNRNLWKEILVSFVPTGIFGFTLYKFIKQYLLNSSLITAVSLLLGGIVLLIIDAHFKNKEHQSKIDGLTTGKQVRIGLFQTISMIPGVSRSAATIVGGLFSGLSRKDAVEYSFMLAIPTMAAASGYDLLKTGFSFTQSELVQLSIGFLIAFISALIAVKAFTNYISKHNFTYFAIYRIILGILVLLLLR